MQNKVMLRKGELELINKYSRRELTEEEIYAFTVTLCDNDIDRDFERFSDDALEKMAQLFVGKTGICDHEMKSGNQKARIFACYTEKTGEKTSDGRAYKRLCARAYMLRGGDTDTLIDEIEAGIKKEVSVGCSMAERLCSVCGQDRRTGCTHIAGRTYTDKGTALVCHTILSNPTDAYEWSFVAVPAQRRAGVIKSYKEKKKLDPKEIIKNLGDGQCITAAEADGLRSYLAEQNGLCELGRAYLAEKRAAIIKSPVFSESGISEQVINSLIEKMSVAELDEFYRAAKRLEAVPTPQLKSEKEKPDALNGGFMIK